MDELPVKDEEGVLDVVVFSPFCLCYCVLLMVSLFPLLSSLHCSAGLVAAPSVILSELLLVPLIVLLSAVVAVLAVIAVVVFLAVAVNVVYIVLTEVVVPFSPPCLVGELFLLVSFPVPLDVVTAAAFVACPLVQRIIVVVLE